MANNNYLIYPFTSMRWSRSWTTHTSYTHYDYCWDETGEANVDRDWIYCPCDQIKVSSKIDPTNDSETHVLFLESTSPVIMPSGTDYVTIMIVHSYHKDLSKLSVGQTFSRGEKIIQEGNSGTSSGDHFHVAVATGRNGYMSNTNLVTSGKNLKPYEAFYINSSISVNGYFINKVSSAAGFENKFVKLPSNIDTTPQTSTSVTLQRTTTGIKGVDFYNSTGLTGTQLLQDSTYKFALLKCGFRGYGSAGTLNIDDSFNQFYEQLYGKLPIGAWWWPTYISQAEADEEAEYLINTVLKGKTFDLPIYIDVEGHQRWFSGSGTEVNTSVFVNNMSWEKLGTYTATLCEKLKEAGYCPGVYGNRDFFSHSEFLNKIKQYRLWFAWYTYSSPAAHKNAWSEWTYDVFSSYLKKYNLSSIIDQIDFWQPGYCTVNGSSAELVDADLLFTTNLTEYVKNYTGQSSTYSTIIYKKYYTRLVDTNETLNEFTNFSEAIKHINEYNSNKTEEEKIYLYDENNNIVYPYNISFYYVSTSSSLSDEQKIIAKYILLKNAINEAKKQLQKNDENYYIINNKKQCVYCASNKEELYVLRKFSTDKQMGEEDTQIAFGWSVNRIYKDWTELEINQPGKYGVFKIIDINKGEKIYPRIWKYVIYNGDEPYLNTNSNDPNYSIYKSKNLKSLIQICQDLGYPYKIYNEDIQTPVYSIDVDHFITGDIVGIKGDQTRTQYTIETITDEQIKLEGFSYSQEGQGKSYHSKYELYPISTSLSENQDDEFFLNIAYTYLKDENGEEIKTLPIDISFNDVFIVDSLKMIGDSSPTPYFKVSLPKKLQDLIENEDLKSKYYYLERDFLTKNN